MFENFEDLTGGFKFEGDILQNIVSETIMAIDDELITIRNETYRKALVETAYKLRDLRLFIQAHYSNTDVVQAEKFHYSAN